VFAPGGRTLYTAGQDATAIAWDVTGNDGGTLLTSGTDGTVRLWEAAHLRPVGEPLPLLAGEGAFGAFSPDGTRILALDTTGRVTTWPATVQAWLRRACLIVRRAFTPYERTLYSIPPQSPRPCR
jgi:WD40 repeat protein